MWAEREGYVAEEPGLVICKRVAWIKISVCKEKFATELVTQSPPLRLVFTHSL